MDAKGGTLHPYPPWVFVACNGDTFTLFYLYIIIIIIITIIIMLAALAQMVTCLPLVQQIRGSIPGGVVNFHLKIFNLEARRGGDVHFLIASLCITGLY